MINSPLTKCAHPVRIFNKSTKEYMFVPCGHCDNCRHSYTQKWQERLQLESKASVSTLFFTLTYDDSSIPLYLDEGNGYLTPQVDRLQPLDLNQYFNNPSKLFIPYVKTLNVNHSYCVAVPCKRDIQLFLKRLRRYVEYDKAGLLSSVPQSERQIRYFCCAEIGPTTFRPHYHGLLFTRNQQVSIAIKSYYIFQAWQYCRKINLDCSEVFGDASSYVSKYVTSNTSLPSVFSIPQMSTFCLFSRNPTIGCVDFCPSDAFTVAETRSILYHKALKNSKDGQNTVELALPSQLLRYWFPKAFQPSFTDRQWLLQGLSRASKFCSCFDSMSIISDFLPNYINYVKRKYHLFDHEYQDSLGVPCYLTYSDIAKSLTDDERWFGIPQNRMLLKRALYFIHYMKCTAFDYVETYFNFDTFLHSQSYHFQVEYENSLPSIVSNLTKFELLFPSFFLNLPVHICNMGLTDEMIYSDYLSNFDLTLDSFYDDDGDLLPRYNYENSRLIHTESADYLVYHHKVLDSNVCFDKMRKVNELVYFNN